VLIELVDTQAGWITARSDDHPPSRRDGELHDYLTLGADDLLRRC
jgi:hypothetical protein